MNYGSEPGTTGATRLLSGYVADDAISLLREDHRRIDELFRQFDKARTDGERGALAQRICTELLIHARVEEEIFYPALREACESAESEELMDEADIEHAMADRLIEEIMRMRPGEDHYCARVKVLGDYVRHHVQQEQNRMFSRARAARLDMRALGEQILERKKQLQRGVTILRPLAMDVRTITSGLQMHPLEAM